MRFSQVGLTNPLELPFSQVETILSGFTSPIQTASFDAVGDTKASGKPEVIVAGLPSGGSHSTRNLVFTTDNKRMLVSVGSRSNAAEGLGSLIGVLQSWSGEYPLGASLGTETDRAAILMFDPDGKRPWRVCYGHPQLRG